MTLRTIFYIVMVLIFFSCKSKIEILKSIKCDNEVKITRYKTNLFKKRKYGKLVKKGNYFYVYFTENYNNNHIKAYVNNKLFFDKIISTDESLGTTEQGFLYKYKNKLSDTLMIIDANSGNCFDIILDKKYRQLFIYKNNDNWEVIYDNVYPLYE